MSAIPYSVAPDNVPGVEDALRAEVDMVESAPERVVAERGHQVTATAGHRFVQQRRLRRVWTSHRVAVPGATLVFVRPGAAGQGQVVRVRG